MYEIKMWAKGDHANVAWKFFVHDDRSIELVKTPIQLDNKGFQLLEMSRDTMMRLMEGANIADMTCNFISE